MQFPKGVKQTRGGKRKGAGRTPDQVKLLFQNIIEDSHALERLQVILTTTENHDTFLKALSFTTERGWGKVPQPLEHAGKDGQEIKFNIVSYAG